jgi:ribosomal protein S18 acetylase RimI-like enzyme
MRRQGLGRALSEAAVASSAILRSRVPADAGAGRAFLAALGFTQTGAQLSLQWGRSRIEARSTPAVRVRRATLRDEPVLKTLANAAWEGAPDAFRSRADEIAELFSEAGRVVLLAESAGRPAGYLSAVQLGGMLGIEEVAVLPQSRRLGIARALVTHAIAAEEGAVLSVGEANMPARALYRSLGFRQTARRVVMELRRG